MMLKKYIFNVFVYTIFSLPMTQLSMAESLIDNNYQASMYENWITAFAQDSGLKAYHGIPLMKAEAKYYYWDTVRKPRHHSLGVMYFKADQKIEEKVIYYNYIIDYVDQVIGNATIVWDVAGGDYSSAFKESLKVGLETSTANFINAMPINQLHKDEISKQLSDILQTLVLDLTPLESLGSKRAALYQLLFKKAAEAAVNWSGWFASMNAYQSYTSSLLAEAVLDEYYRCGADFAVMRAKYKGENEIWNLPPKPYNYTDDNWLIRQYVKILSNKNNYNFDNLTTEDYDNIHETISFIKDYTSQFFTYYENNPEKFTPRRSGMRPIISLLLSDKSTPSTTEYTENFTNNPNFTSLSTSHAYWDASEGNYYVNTYDNLNAKYWAYSPQFGPMDTTKAINISFDILFENQNWGTYPQIGFYASEPIEIGANGNKNIFAIDNAYRNIYVRQMGIYDGSSGHQYYTPQLTNNSWYNVSIITNGSNKADISVTDISSGTLIYNVSDSDFMMRDFSYLGIGYYGQPDYGSAWSPIRVDNISVKYVP